jgi:hypothetical protein
MSHEDFSRAGNRAVPEEVLVKCRSRSIAMFAQAIGEYGAAGSLGASVQSFAYSVGVWFGSVSPMTWAVVAVVVVGLFFWLRR